MKKIFTNQYSVISLEDLKLKPELAVIEETNGTIDELLRNIQKISEIISVSQNNKKIKYFYVVNEDIGDELNIKDMRNYKTKSKAIKKLFKKYRNVYFFINNTVKTDFETPTLEVEPPIESPIEINDINLPPVPLDGIQPGETIVSNDFIDGILNSRGGVLDDYDRKIQEALAARRQIINEAVEAAVALEKEKIRAELESAKYLEDIIRAKELALKNGHAIRDENGEIQFTKDIFAKEYLAEANEMKISKEIFYKTTGTNKGDVVDAKVYALKSIFDFIWRMYILHYGDSNIHDLLYYVGVSIPTISRSQSDFIKKVAHDSNSLFDLMVKMDYELKYDGALFYVYLASIFIIKDGVVYVNRRYINSITFIEGDKIFELCHSLEMLINEIDLYKEKIIYSHYIEFTNFYKSEFARIRSSLKLSDIQNVINKRNLLFRRENIFVIILNNITLLAAMKFVNLKNVVDNPNSLVEIEGRINQNISKAYIVLIGEIKNYMLLDISNYETIFEIYNELLQIDIDLVISDDPEVQARAVTLSESIKSDLAEIVSYELDMKEKLGVTYEDIDLLYKNRDQNLDETDEELFERTFRKKLSKDKLTDISLINILEKSEESKIDNTDKKDLSEIVYDFEERIKNNIKKIEEERAKINKTVISVSGTKFENPKIIKIKAN